MNTDTTYSIAQNLKQFLLVNKGRAYSLRCLAKMFDVSLEDMSNMIAHINLDEIRIYMKPTYKNSLHHVKYYIK